MSFMDASQVLKELGRVGYKIGVAAENLDIPISQVQEVITYRGRKPKPPAERRPPPVPPHLRAYLIGSKPADDSWPIELDAAIRRARAAHNAGTHSLSQRTEKGWTRLYLLPLKNPVPPRNYFPQEML